MTDKRNFVCFCVPGLGSTQIAQPSWAKFAVVPPGLNTTPGAGAPPSVCEGGTLEFAGEFLNGINGNPSCLALFIVQITAPGPILRTGDQLPSDRIAVHVIEFLAYLFVGVHIEIIEPRLPKLRKAAGTVRKRQAASG